MVKSHSRWVDELAFAPDGSTLASACTVGTVELWDMTDGSLKQKLRHTDRVTIVQHREHGITLDAEA
jgi:WD40 repeat protein